MDTYIITFYSHFSAIGFQKAMKKTGIESTLMPVPRHLSSSCGTCVKLVCESDSIHSFTKQDGIEKIFHFEQENVYLIYEP